MDKIILKNIKAFGHTGCLPQEKADGQYFYITCEITCEEIPGRISDELNETIDYSKVCELILKITAEDRSDLIEHLAYKIADSVLKTAPLASRVDVTVSKPSAPVDAEFETMEVRISVAR